MDIVDKYMGEADYDFTYLDDKGNIIHVGAKSGFGMKAKNTQDALKKAKQNMKDFPGAQKVRLSIKGRRVGDFSLNEVMGYRMKPKDKKLAMAFISGDAKDGDEGATLFVDGDELRSGMSTIATRDAKGNITPGTAYGNVSQTWINFIRKNTPKLMLK